MYRLKWFGIAVSAVFAAGGVVASSASALLPTVLFLSGATSVLLRGSKSGAGIATFRTKALVITAGKIAGEATGLFNGTHLGPALIILLESKDTSTGDACTQAGQAEGVVHITGEWHLVYVALGVSLKVGGLILVPKTIFKCGETSISTEGTQLEELAKIPASEADGTEIEGIAKCEGAEKTTPALTKYENEAGTEVTVSLLSTVAGIKEKTCEELSISSVLRSSVASQMFKIDL